MYVQRRPFPRSALLLCIVCLVFAACGGLSVAKTAPQTADGNAQPIVAVPARAGLIDPSLLIEKMIAKMSLDQKIGQMFMVEFLGTDYNSYIDTMVRGAHAGGVLVYNNDARTIASMQRLNADMQAHADFPLFLGLDQEGGEVNRLANFYGYAPSAATLASTGDPQRAFNEAVKDAKEMIGLGFNVNLAPVVDVRSTPDAWESSRLWSDSPTTTAQFAGAFLAGTQSQGVIGSIKHWPGIGSTNCTPDYCLPVLSHSLDQLNAIDFAPFKALIPKGPGMIMVTETLVPALDPKFPATLSPTIVTEYLRGKMGYQGVVITDSLHQEGTYVFMRSIGIRDFPRMLTEATILAILAGSDILEGAFDPDSALAMLSAIRSAVQSGRIPLTRIEASVRRILRLKWAYGIGIDRLEVAAGVPSQALAAPVGALAQAAFREDLAG